MKTIIMANKTKPYFSTKKFPTNSKNLAEPPIAMDLSREITKMFDLKSRKNERISEYMCKSIRKTKLRALQKVAKVDVIPSVTRPSTSKDFRDFSERCPTTEMSRFQEKHIRQKIQSRGLEKIHSQIVDDFMKDTKLEFQKITHYAGVNLKVRDKFPEDGFKVKPYRFLGRTPNYEQFLCVRKQFGIRWILHFLVMRKLLEECVLGLPHELFHLKLVGVMDLEELKCIFKEKIQYSSNFLHDFHRKISVILDRQKDDIRKRPSKFLSACTRLFSIHVSRCIAHTLQSVVQFTESVDVPPYLKLLVDFEEGLVLRPTSDDVISVFWTFLDDLMGICGELYVLEKGRIVGYETRTIFLFLTQEFVQRCKEDIADNIKRLYSPISIYLEKLGDDFKEIYSDVNSESFFESISDILFEDGCRKIQYYKKYLHKVAYIPDNEYFKIGQLVLTNYREKLQDSLQLIIDSIFKNLSSQHLWEVNDICDSFKLIKARATQKPLTTEELIEIGKFMSWVRDEHLEELNQRLYDSLQSLCNIITLGLLTEDHMSTNSSAIIWLDQIPPIVELHSTNYEQLKFEAEEKLQKVIEDINVLIKDVYPLLVVLDEMDDIKRARKYLSDITLHMTKIKEIYYQIEWINKEEVCLSFPKSHYAEFENLKDYVYPFYHLLKLCLDVQRHVSVWQYGQFDRLDYVRTNEMAEKFCKDLEGIQKGYRKKLRQAQDENLPIRFKGTVDDPDLLNWPAPLKLCAKTMKILEDFKPSLQVMKIMCNTSLRTRHWKAMSELAGFNITPNAGTTLKKIMDIDLKDKLQEYEIISTGAFKEKQLLDNLNDLKSQWETINFAVTKINEDTTVLTKLEDIECIVNDHTIQVLNMRGSVFVQVHEKDVKDFFDTILRISSVLCNWRMVQDEWLKLLPIFALKKVQKVIPKETELFESCNKVFKSYVEKIEENSVVLETVAHTNIVEDVNLCLETLEEVKKGVRYYLETIRQQCPRLYFISNEELVVLIAQNQDVWFKTYLKKIFPGINDVRLSDARTVCALVSSCNEEVVLKNAVDCSGLNSLEDTLNMLENGMLHTLKLKTSECYKVFKKTSIKDLVKKFPQQSLQLMAQVFWTDQVENALKLSHNIKLLIYKRKLEANIEDKVQLLAENDKVTNLERTVIKNLLLTDLNNKYLLNVCLKDGVIDDNHFNWQMQIRFYFQKSLCTSKILHNTVDYGYEYLGNSSQIVLTPVTDRCYRTLLNAYFFNFCGLVRGQSQSGKSKTLKSLAQTFGMLFVFFTCTRFLTSDLLVQLLKGNTMCGSWLCLENFDRLRSEMFSMISQEILGILNAKKQRTEKVFLDKQFFVFNPTSFVCVVTDVKTNYVIPENLKVLFRTFTMCKPDRKMFAEAVLTSVGVKEAKLLGRKLATSFGLLEDMLSVQKQYFFGFKSLKNILRLFESNKVAGFDESDECVLCRCVRKVFYPCLVDLDQTIFDDILFDVFQTNYTADRDIKDDTVVDVVKTVCDDLHLYVNHSFAKKVLEVFDVIKHRRSTIIIGNSFSGKTTVSKVCAKVFEKILKYNVKTHIINSKCLSYTDLFGTMSQDKKFEWMDGVFLKMLRTATRNKSLKNWIIFDGYVESFWAESLYSVLEDQQIFLGSGEIFLIDKSTSLLFEVTELSSCSPSMVSRCGIVYLPPSTLNWMSLVESWLKTCKSCWLTDYQNHVSELFKWFIPPCLKTITDFGPKLCDPDENALVNTTLTYFKLILDDVTSNSNRTHEDPKNMPSWIHATFLQAGLWSFGGILNSCDRQKFDEFYKQLWRGQNTNYPYPECLERLEVGIPHECILFDYCYLYKQRGTWKLWSDLLKNEKIIESRYLNGFLVPTVDTMRCSFFVELHIKYNKRFMVVGPNSTGKSDFLRDCFINKLNEKYFEKSVITFNKNITPVYLQNLVLSKLNKKKGGCYSPSSEKRFIFFLDDLNLSLPDTNHHSSALELLRQHFDHKTWYDLKNFEKINFNRSNFIASANHNEHTLPTRFLRHFNILGINEFSCDTITRIYSQVLLHSWKKAGFPSDILTAVTQIVTATLNIYKTIKKHLKPTLSRCQYVFELISFSKVVQACTHLKKESYDANKKVYVKLWVHEIFRVFGDRLDKCDLKWLSSNLKDSVGDYFSESVEDIFGDCAEELPFRKLFFGTFNEKNPGNSAKQYDEVNFQQLTELCALSIKEYNESNTFKLNMIFFNYSLEKLARICRILSMPNENALLLGSTGYGRQSLTKIASFMYKHDFHEPVITQSYDLTHWKRDFKEVLKASGGLDRPSVFLIAEDQIIDDNFFENIDHFLRDGEITDLYEPEEKQEILELARLSAQGGNRNLDISSHRVFLYFNKRCRENLHLMLCLNYDSETLRKRFLKYPSLVTRFTVILWKDWPNSALEAVAQTWTKDVNLHAEVKERTIDAAIFFHRTCQILPELKKVVTPKAYIHLIRLFSDLIVRKQEMLFSKKKRYLQGLAKLSYASRQISDMQKTLAEYQPQLETMTKNAVEMTEQIALETIEVERASALVRKDEKIASEQAVVAQVLKSECESELAQAIPILEDAISALNTLKPSDITLVKSMKNPPDAIKLVMASVCVIKDVRPDRIPDPSTGRKTIDYWGPSKRILGDMNFLQTLKDFDKDHIKPEIMAKIRKEYLPHKDFKPHVVAKASSAAEGLCKWIIAMDMYDRVAKEVAPKKEKLNKAEREYAETMRVLNEKKEEVVRIEEKLATLNVLLDEAIRKQTKLQTEVDICNKKLGSAQKLIGGLSGEKLRWTEASDSLQKHYDVLAGDIMLSSAVVAYLAPLSSEIRSQVMKKWYGYIKENEIPCSKVFNFAQVLSNDVEIEHWKEHGLPLDKFFVENAAIYSHSKNFCLFMDPQGQASAWIQKMEEGSNIVVTKFTYKDWLPCVKQCVVNGKPILIKDTSGNIPSCLNSLLYGQKFTRNDDDFFTIDRQDVKIHKKFRLYIVCTKSDPSYSLELRSRVNTINFALTKNALEEEMLKIVVEIEKPDIIKLTKQLVHRNRENKADLKDLELKILDTLCESETDILEDEESIIILDKSKELANILRDKQEESKIIDKRIKDFKRGYVNVAQHVTNLFFCITDLHKLHYFYQFSLDWYKNLYFTSILNAGKSKVLEVRCQNLCNTFTYDLFKSISKGLFEKDKLLFTFWLACGVSIGKGYISREEVSGFFGKKRFFESRGVIDKPEWLSGDIWEELENLECSTKFVGFVKFFSENVDAWKSYCENLEDTMPYPWNDLNDFEKLVLIKILKPETLYYGIIDFIKSTLGEQFLAPMFFDMQETYNESYSLSPILFMSTPGTNVLNIMRNFASIKQVLHKFQNLTLGGENFKKANALIQAGQKEGAWVLLQNCQFATDWLDELEQNLGSFDFENTHENFRLFLTVDPTSGFPLDLLQNCIKVVDEPPNILRKNLLKVFTKLPIMSDDFFYGCPGKQETFSKLLYSFCHFHFLLQERQKISNWNVPYRFGETDLMISLEQLRHFVTEDMSVFEKIYFFLGECNYGGYLENTWEKRFISAVLSDCINFRVFEKKGFLFNGAKLYGMPSKNDRQDYLQHIHILPPQDDPKVLYLTSYEFLRHKIVKTKKFLDAGLRMVQNNDDRMVCMDDFKVLNIIDAILKEVPTNIVVNNVDELQAFILREVKLYNHLLSTIRISLEELRGSLGGDSIMTEHLEVLANDLVQNKLPQLWRHVCYPTLLNLSKFVDDLCRKVLFFKNIYQNNNKMYWLGAFFYPKALTSSIKINFARKNNLSVENIDFNFDFKSPNTDIDPDYTLLENLYVLGAKFDTCQKQLTELDPKTYYAKLPPLIIKPVSLIVDDDSVGKKIGKFSCFVYKTEVLGIENFDGTFLPGCKNFVDEIYIDSEREVGYWVKRGMDETTAQELFDMINADVSMVDEQVAQDLLNKSLHDSEIRVFAKGQDIQQVQQRMVHTPAGLQPVLQQTYTEKRVERDEMAEKVVKNLSVIEIDETTGLGTRVTISEQQLDPGYGLSNEGRDVVTVKETISITPSYTSTAKDIIHEVTKPLIDIDPAELAQLVEEESQDVENTLQMAPPDLTLSPEKYGIKKRLQKLRLNSESMVLLEESVVNPTPTADEALVETPPEALASIMHTVESGVTPQCAPDQVFNTLFEEKGDEQCITLSSIGPGPLQDVMVPQELPIELHKEAMTSDLTKLTDIIRNVSDPEEIPHVDIFSAVMEADQKTTKRGIKSRPFKPIHEEDLPWSDQDLEPLVNIVGAEPAVVLDPANIPDLETSGTLEQELTHGIEYFVEADPVQYMSRVQLRGTYAPPWFPGYIYALPEFQEVVKIARCPDEVFASSWKSCQPRIIPDESISILP